MNNYWNRTVEYLNRVWPYMVSLGGAIVMLVAWFIPSIQDQYDRYESRKVIERYVELGDDFMNEEQFKMAEEAYGKAYELSEPRRLDIEVKRLSAKINRVNSEIEWGQDLPEDLQEIDFQFVIHFLKGKAQERQRLSAMDCYGVFLAHSGREIEAEQIYMEILKDHPGETLTWMNLGNLYEHHGREEEAEAAYAKALVLEPDNVWAHYYLGHFLSEQGRFPEAEVELGKVVRLDPADSDVVNEYREVVAKVKK